MNQRICDHKQNKINLLPSPSYLLLRDLKCAISCDETVTKKEGKSLAAGEIYRVFSFPAKAGRKQGGTV